MNRTIFACSERKMAYFSFEKLTEVPERFHFLSSGFVIFFHDDGEGFEDDNLAGGSIECLRHAFIRSETGRDDVRKSSIALFSVT